MAWKIAFEILKKVLSNIYAFLIIGGVVVYNLLRNNRTLSTDRKRLQEAIGRLNDIYQMDDASVCSELGGMREQCDELRSRPPSSGDK